MNIIEKARIFATAAHAAVGQKRKYTGQDYIVHPEEVANIVATTAGVTEEMIAAAWLHDTVEDTHISFGNIHDMFGNEVLILVSWLTDVSKPEDGNRALRKSMDRKHTAESSHKAQTIKLSDLISNTKSITEYDPSFAKIYMNEKEALLKVLVKGDKNLQKIAAKQLYNFRKSIGNTRQKERLE